MSNTTTRDLLTTAVPILDQVMVAKLEELQTRFDLSAAELQALVTTYIWHLLRTSDSAFMKGRPDSATVERLISKHREMLENHVANLRQQRSGVH